MPVASRLPARHKRLCDQVKLSVVEVTASRKTAELSTMIELPRYGSLEQFRQNLKMNRRKNHFTEHPKAVTVTVFCSKSFYWQQICTSFSSTIGNNRNTSIIAPPRSNVRSLTNADVFCEAFNFLTEITAKTLLCATERPSVGQVLIRFCWWQFRSVHALLRFLNGSPIRYFLMCPHSNIWSLTLPLRYVIGEVEYQWYNFLKTHVFAAYR